MKWEDELFGLPCAGHIAPDCALALLLILAADIGLDFRQ